jgi:hypothetical protein
VHIHPVSHSVIASFLALVTSTLACGQSSGFDFGPEVRRNRIVTADDMLHPAPLVPRDIYRKELGNGARHDDLATFAWLEFIALNAPVGSRRGTPGGSFAAAGAAPTARLVWETYHHRAELLPYNRTGPVPPNGWDATPTYTYGIGNRIRIPYVTPFNLYNNLDETSQIGQNLMFIPGISEDAQILFQAKVNEVEWSYVNDNFDGTLTHISYDPDSESLFISPPIVFPDNVIEVKSSWRPLSSIPLEERHRYHTSNVIFYEGTDDAPVARTGEYALIGLHIIHKTRNYPTFIFATFEQVDVLESGVSGQPTGAYYIPTYDEISYQLTNTTTFPATGTVYQNPSLSFDVKRPRARPGKHPVDLPIGPVADIEGAVTYPDGVHVPIVQPPTTNRAVEKVNEEALAAMLALPGFDENFVWQYYRLKGVQAVASDKEGDDDFYLANIGIESSQPGIQLFRGGVTIDLTSTPTMLMNNVNKVNVQDPKQDNQVFSAGGCMGCHGVAQTRSGLDFSFLLFGADGIGFSPDTIGVPSKQHSLDRLYRYGGQLRR